MTGTKLYKVLVLSCLYHLQKGAARRYPRRSTATVSPPGTSILSEKQTQSDSRSGSSDGLLEAHTVLGRQLLESPCPQLVVEPQVLPA